MKKLIFLCIAIVITAFSAIVLNISPVIHELGSFEYHDDCQKYSDKYNYIKEKEASEILPEYTEIDHIIPRPISEDEKEPFLDHLKEGENKCKKNKAIVGLEYTSFNFNIVFGFTSVILGLLYYLSVGNNLGKIIELIGLGVGVIGFSLTFIYAIYSGDIFSNTVVGKSFLNYYSK